MTNKITNKVPVLYKREPANGEAQAWTGLHDYVPATKPEILRAAYFVLLALEANIDDGLDLSLLADELEQESLTSNPPRGNP